MRQERHLDVSNGWFTPGSFAAFSGDGRCLAAVSREDKYLVQLWDVPTGARLAVMKVLAADAPAPELQRRMREHIARDKDPELADVRIVRGSADFDEMIPPFVRAFLSHLLRTGH